MKKLIILVLIVVAAGPASAQKVTVRVDNRTELSKYKTYGWDKSTLTGNPLILATTMDAVDQAMASKGLSKVETNPELTIWILTSTESDLYIAQRGSADKVGSGLPSGMAVNTQRWPITKGTLMIGMNDAQTNNSIWQATATHTLESGPSGNAVQDAKIVEKPIRKAVEKMFKRFPHTR